MGFRGGKYRKPARPDPVAHKIRLQKRLEKAKKKSGFVEDDANNAADDFSVNTGLPARVDHDGHSPAANSFIHPSKTDMTRRPDPTFLAQKKYKETQSRLELQRQVFGSVAAHCINNILQEKSRFFDELSRTKAQARLRRKNTKHQLSRRTAKGQPNLGNHITHLLDKIQKQADAR